MTYSEIRDAIREDREVWARQSSGMRRTVRIDWLRHIPGAYQGRTVHGWQDIELDSVFVVDADD